MAALSLRILLFPGFIVRESGSSISLECGSNNQHATLYWFDDVCGQSLNGCAAQHILYNGSTLNAACPAHYGIAVNGSTKKARNLIINNLQMSDSKIYVCAEKNGPRYNATFYRVYVYG